MEDLVFFSHIRNWWSPPRTLELILVPTSDGAWDIEGFAVAAGLGRDQAQRVRLT